METMIGQANPQGATNDADLVKDTTDKTFMRDVIEASRQVPILVDFWAPWCGPCKQLGPALEKAVRAARGAVRLVKLNVDKERMIAQQMGIQSIPAVFAFRNGQPVDGFVGALPESQLRAFIQRLLGDAGGASEIEQAVEAARAALEAGDLAEAAQIFGAILQEEPGNPAALAGLARCYIAGRDVERAKQTLSLVPPDAQNHPEVESARAALTLLEQTAEAGDVRTLRKVVEEDPNAHQARYDLALALLGAGDREGAVEQLLELARRDREWNEQAARKQLVKLFEAFGPTDPLTVATRRRLSSLLFS